MKKSHKYIIFGICFFLMFGHILPWVRMQWPFNTNFEMRGSFFIGGFIFLMIELADAEWDKMKHRSPQIQSDDVTSSITGSAKDTERRGKWTATRLGGIMWKGFGMAGKEGTLIAPEIAIDNKLAAGTFVHAKAERVGKESLPPLVKDMVEESEMPEPYYLSMAPSEVELQNQAFLDWKRDKKQQNQGKNAIEATLNKGFRLTRQLQEMKDLSASSKMKGKVQKLEEKIESMGGSEED
ncbi:MAG: hypothetical protein KGY68_09290 [Candidatus Thermoplasmatota archaeon]|nr:hypothetical protein [Candidatus Thermoplasmatota archaeon]